MRLFSPLSLPCDILHTGFAHEVIASFHIHHETFVALIEATGAFQRAVRELYFSLFYQFMSKAERCSLLRHMGSRILGLLIAVLFLFLFLVLVLVLPRPTLTPFCL
jgi:hypothetical protein